MNFNLPNGRYHRQRSKWWVIAGVVAGSLVVAGGVVIATDPFTTAEKRPVLSMPLPVATAPDLAAGSIAVPDPARNGVDLISNDPTSAKDLTPLPGGRTNKPTQVPADTMIIPSIGVSAAVQDTGVDASGVLIVPEPVDHVGQYVAGGKVDADNGVVIIAGHVNNKSQGPGALYNLSLAKAGDLVYVNRGGVTSRWKIAADPYFTGKTALPAEIASPEAAARAADAGDRRLFIITCGGDLEVTAGIGSYDKNVIVEAVPF